MRFFSFYPPLNTTHRADFAHFCSVLLSVFWLGVSLSSVRFDRNFAFFLKCSVFAHFYLVLPSFLRDTSHVTRNTLRSVHSMCSLFLFLGLDWWFFFCFCCWFFCWLHHRQQYLFYRRCVVWVLVCESPQSL